MEIHKTTAVGPSVPTVSKLRRVGIPAAMQASYGSAQAMPEPFDIRPLKLVATAHRNYQIPVLGALERNFFQYAINGFMPRSLLANSIAVARL